MATVTAFIRISKKNIRKCNVRFRLRDGADIQMFHASNIEVDPSCWDKDKQEIKAKIVFDPVDRLRINRDVADRKSLILEIYNDARDKSILTSEWLDSEIDRRLHPEKYASPAAGFFEVFDDFLDKHKMSDVYRNNYRVIYRALQRYELYRKLRGDNSTFSLQFDTLDAEMLHDIDVFMRSEYLVCREYPEIYEAVPESRLPKQRGDNTMNGIFKKIRTLFVWANKFGKTKNTPFDNFEIVECVYGTPYYITIEERNRIYRTNLSRHPDLSVQRYIFVFQCLIGCRVGDLYRMTKRNVINGAIEYVARKTRDGRPITVRVPLNSIAKEILGMFKGYDGESLFPFTYVQKYNDDIKLVFLAARVNRLVTVINPTTREPEIHPINEIASSHLARRCFVGNLYKQVKDPNLVGALSGHKEGSRAFSRYREIDEEMKTELVKLLE